MDRPRPSSHGPMGKYDCKIGDFHFYQTSKDILMRKAAAQGIELSEYLRRICLVDAHGVDVLTNIHRKQYESIRRMSEMVE